MPAAHDEDALAAFERLFDRTRLLKLLLDLAVEETGASNGSIMMYSVQAQELYIAHASGLSERVVRNTRQPFFQAIFDLESKEMAFGRVALLGDAAFVARPHCGMGVTKAAGDAMRLAGILHTADNDVPAALPLYAAERVRFGTAVVQHARELGAFLQGSNTEAARSHHTPEAVMREIAVTRDFP